MTTLVITSNVEGDKMSLRQKDYFNTDDLRWSPKDRPIMNIYTVLHRYGKRLFREEYEATATGMKSIMEELQQTIEPPDAITVFLDGKQIKL